MGGFTFFAFGYLILLVLSSLLVDIIASLIFNLKYSVYHCLDDLRNYYINQLSNFTFEFYQIIYVI